MFTTSLFFALFLLGLPPPRLVFAMNLGLKLGILVGRAERDLGILMTVEGIGMWIGYPSLPALVMLSKELLPRRIVVITSFCLDDEGALNGSTKPPIGEIPGIQVHHLPGGY